MTDITRKEAIKELKEYEEGLDMEYATPFDKAVLFAINSLEVDEQYNLMYEESIQGKVENMIDSNTESNSIADLVHKISMRVNESMEEFIFETIEPYCESITQMKVSKNELVQALTLYRNMGKITSELRKWHRMRFSEVHDMGDVLDLIGKYYYGKSE